jgi:hypothetical protein
VAVGGGANQGDALGTTGAGVALSWDGASWSNPSVYFPSPVGGPTVAPIRPAISCTTGPLCVIADGSGHVSTGDGTNWSTPALLPSGSTTLPPNPADPGSGQAEARERAVSCPTATFCAFIDTTGLAQAFRSGSWVASQALGTGTPTTALFHAGRPGISCRSAAACTAVVGTRVADWDGAHWTLEGFPWTTSLDGGPTSDTAISCNSAFCAVVNGRMVSYRMPGQAWSTPQAIDPAGGLDAIGCPTSTFCMASDAHGSVTSWNGTSWSMPRQVIPAPTGYTGLGTSLSCPSAQFCLLLDGDGDYATYTGG